MAAPDAPPPAKKLRALPPPGNVADPGKHVFIPLKEYAAKIDELFGADYVVFIRGGVATGKSTLAAHLAREYPNKYLLVPFTDGTEEEWKKDIVRAINKVEGSDGIAVATDAVKFAQQRGLIMVFDEAHTIFASTTLCVLLFKSDDRPKVLLFSAAGEAAMGAAAVTPSEITRKFMWTPPMPKASELKGQLAMAGVNLDEASVDFFLSFCAGHYGIFMMAMSWVHMKQGKSSVEWNLGRTVGEVRDSYGEEDWGQNKLLGELSKCRAIRVNGLFEDVEKIPEEFVHILCGGPDCIDDARTRRELTIHGFVLPRVASNEQEFRDLDWTNTETKYKVANALLATYYRNVFTRKRGLSWTVEPFEPESCADLLMRAVPYLTFSRVTGYPPGTNRDSPLSSGGLPYEDQYNTAIVDALKSLTYKAVAALDPTKGLGKIDCLVTLEQDSGAKLISGMEGVMAVRGPAVIQEHRDRFEQYHRYKEATHKALYIIGGDVEDVVSKVKAVKTDGVEIIGLVPNSAHSHYTVLVRTKDAEAGSEPISFGVECDLVARSFRTSGGVPDIQCVQKLSHIDPPPGPTSGAAASSSSAAAAETVRIGVVYKGKAVAVKFRRTSNPEAIKEAIRQRVRLPGDLPLELLDEDGDGVTIDGSLPEGRYTVPE